MSVSHQFQADDSSQASLLQTGLGLSKGKWIIPGWGCTEVGGAAALEGSCEGLSQVQKLRLGDAVKVHGPSQPGTLGCSELCVCHRLCSSWQLLVRGGLGVWCVRDSVGHMV